MHPVDGIIGDALRALRIHGSLLLRESYQPPFRVAVPPAEDLRSLLRTPVESRAVAFHLAEKGSFEIRRPESIPLVVESGEIVLSFGGQAHQLAMGEGAPTVDFTEVLAAAEGRLYGPAPASGTGAARITCGALVFHDTHLNPLFASLPGVLHLRSGSEGSRRLRDYISMLCAEIARRDPAAEYVVERLLEVICAEAIRGYATERQEDVGWFRGIGDRSVGQALAAFHGAPGQPWSVGLLARAVHLSPSRFAARFADATGSSVMTYVTRWRMNLAMRALAHTGNSVAQIAHEIGYESLPAFSRAFKKHVGTPPASYRRQRRS